MEKRTMQELIRVNKAAKFPQGTCCAKRCADCRYMEMDNDFYNDGTRRCKDKGRWLSPSTPACPNFKY